MKRLLHLVNDLLGKLTTVQQILKYRREKQLSLRAVAGTQQRQEVQLLNDRLVVIVAAVFLGVHQLIPARNNVILLHINVFQGVEDDATRDKIFRQMVNLECRNNGKHNVSISPRLHRRKNSVKENRGDVDSGLDVKLDNLLQSTNSLRGGLRVVLHKSFQVEVDSRVEHPLTHARGRTGNVALPDIFQQIKVRLTLK